MEVLDEVLISDEEFAKKMQSVAKTASCDTEGAHIEADGLMCELLIRLGYEKGVDVFEHMDKWYA